MVAFGNSLYRRGCLRKVGFKVTDMRKNLSDLTDGEAKEILKYVYPNDKDNYFERVQFENKDNRLTFGFREVIGILYRGGTNQDGCILHFDNTKVVQWLYLHDFDITEQLECNKGMSEMESKFDHFATAALSCAAPIEEYREGYKQNYNIDSIRNRLREAYEKYYL